MRRHGNRSGTFAVLSVPFFALGVMILFTPDVVEVGGTRGAGNLAQGLVLLSIGVLILAFSSFVRWVSKNYLFKEEKGSTTSAEAPIQPQKSILLVDGSAPLRDLLATLFVNVSLMFPFLASLVRPTNANFIYETSYFLAVVEFLSMHSSAFAASQNSLNRTEKIKRFPKTLFLMFLYLLIVVGISVATKNPAIALFFMVSLTGKMFGNRLYRDKVGQQAGYSLVALFSSVAIVALIGPMIAQHFPLPTEIVIQRPTSSNGPLLDSPQLILIWGILYFTILSALQIWSYRRPTTTKSQ